MLQRFFQRFLKLGLLTVLTFGLLVACNAATSQNSGGSDTAKPLSVASAPWPGFSAHYVALAKDFFKEEGITVQDQFFQVQTDANTALLANKVDLLWTGVPDMVFAAGQDPDIRVMMLADYSNGADGILARNVSKPSDLKQKPIAWEALPLQVLLLNKYLEQDGLSQNDVQLLNMAAAEAATAFAAKQVDAAVTYEPWLTKAATQGKGEIVFSSKNTNIIPDGLMAKVSVMEARRSEIAAYMKAIDKAVQFIRSNPQESAEIIAAKLGLKPEEIPAILEGVRLFDVQENKTIAFNPSNPLNVMDSIQFAAKTGSALKLIPGTGDPTKIYDDSIVKGL